MFIVILTAIAVLDSKDKFLMINGADHWGDWFW
jgi:hypothetical protein